MEVFRSFRVRFWGHRREPKAPESDLQPVPWRPDPDLHKARIKGLPRVSGRRNGGLARPLL